MYPVVFKHVPSVADKVVEVLQLPEGTLGDEGDKSVTILEPVAMSRTVRQFSGNPLVV